MTYAINDDACEGVRNAARDDAREDACDAAREGARDDAREGACDDASSVSATRLANGGDARHAIPGIETAPIKLYDTQLHAKVSLEPLEPGHIKMYVCGPTVYNYIHIGNARTFVSFDMVRRYLLWRGYKVSFVQNVTDVDDKIITKANEEGRSAAEVAAEYTQAFIDDMHALGIMDPTVRPLATQEIQTMIDLVGDLIGGDHAYATDAGDVYFNVRSFNEYGKLSGRNIDEMEAGHRDLRSQGLEDRKNDPLDFALWKAAKPGEPAWDSPWGKGRPGWHIECSCMSEKYLGLPFDIHGGGADLCFPHHENERAQSQAARGKTFAEHWMHGGMLQVNSEKMSKSLGNFLLLREVLQKVDAHVLRFLMLQTHYRSPLDYAPDRLQEAATALERLVNTVKTLKWAARGENAQARVAVLKKVTVEKLLQDLKTAFVEAMDDDFNSAGALGAIFEFSAAANSFVAGKQLAPTDAPLAEEMAATIVELLAVLGIDEKAFSQEDSCDYPQELIDVAHELVNFTGGDAAAAAKALLDARADARANKDWARADAVRDAFTDLGYAIKDTPQGVQLEQID